MANFYKVNDDRDVRDMLYSRPDNALDDYHDELLSDRGIGGNMSSRFRDKLKVRIDKAKNSRVARRAKSSFRKLRNRGRVDRIEALLDIGELQHAPPRMQTLIMANPNVRRRWQNRRLEGYINGYSTRAEQRRAVKHSHSTYRMLLDTAVHRDEDGSAVAHTYILDSSEKGVFSEADKAIVRRVWADSDERLWDGLEDFTSEANAML